MTSAAPVPFSTIFAAASRSVCEGPTVRTTSDIPSLTCICALLSLGLRVRANRLKPTRARGADSTLCGRPRHIDSGRASRRPMPKPLEPHPPAARPRRPGGRRAGRLRLRDDHRRRRARPRPLHPEMRHLPRAGAGGDDRQIGPDLDHAFAAARAAGEDGDTIEGVVKAQVEYPRPSNDNPAVSMPADIVTGQDLEDVAAYVGKWAGVPGAAPPEGPGRPGRPGLRQQRLRRLPHPRRGRSRRRRSGPNLDEVLPGQSAAMIEEIDRRPERRDRQGLPAERDAARTTSRRSARRNSKTWSST